MTESKKTSADKSKKLNLTKKNVEKLAEDYHRMARYNNQQQRSEAFNANLHGKTHPKLATTITLNANHEAAVKQYLDGWTTHFESLEVDESEDQADSSSGSSSN